VAGSAWAAVAVGWLSPVLILLSIGLLARSFYVLYVLKRGTRTVRVLTWLSASFVVCFWTWWLLLRQGGV
jgi:hypothetical protein